MKRRSVWLFAFLFILFIPTLVSAEWKQFESKYHQNDYGTKYLYETNMSYAAASTAKTPIVVLWGKTVYNGKSDPEYSQLIRNGCPPEMTSVEAKYLIDVNKKKRLSFIWPYTMPMGKSWARMSSPSRPICR